MLRSDVNEELTQWLNIKKRPNWIKIQKIHNDIKTKFWDQGEFGEVFKMKWLLFPLMIGILAPFSSAVIKGKTIEATLFEN